MRKAALVLYISLALSRQGWAQDTFSIVAVDTLTGEIGSAGASCVTSSATYPHGAAILSDMIPGIGAIHTQAAWNSTNQANAHDHMIAGESPQEIINWLVANDAQGNPSIRQYGIVDFRNGAVRAAAYTGVNCLTYKNDTAGYFYSIQGNILLGQGILDSMQAWFLGTQGTLADRLMAALQGAKVVGADTRCAPRNSSSLSAFLRVAQVNNLSDSLYIDLWMAYPQGYPGQLPVDPIDSLQTLYDQWKMLTPVFDQGKAANSCVKVIALPDGTTGVDFSLCPGYSKFKLILFDITGRKIFSDKITGQIMYPFPEGTTRQGMFIYLVLRQDNSIAEKGKLLSR